MTIFSTPNKIFPKMNLLICALNRTLLIINKSTGQLALMHTLLTHKSCPKTTRVESRHTHRTQLFPSFYLFVFTFNPSYFQQTIIKGKAYQIWFSYFSKFGEIINIIYLFIYLFILNTTSCNMYSLCHTIIVWV